MLYEYLVTAFGFNEPIFTSDIQFEDYSKIWIAKELSKLCEKKQLIRYERGIYYIPKKRRLMKAFWIRTKWLNENTYQIKAKKSDFIRVLPLCSKPDYQHRFQMFLKFKQITKIPSCAELRWAVRKSYSAKQELKLIMKILLFCNFSK